jgi:hypothetical protein
MVEEYGDRNERAMMRGFRNASQMDRMTAAIRADEYDRFERMFYQRAEELKDEGNASALHDLFAYLYQYMKDAGESPDDIQTFLRGIVSP